MADKHLMFDQAYGKEYEAHHTSQENFVNCQIPDVITFSAFDMPGLKSTFNAAVK